MDNNGLNNAIQQTMQDNNTIEEISAPTQSLIEAYLHLPNLGVPCPYYNNRRNKTKASLRALVGKGSPQEIADEAQLFCLREKISLDKLSPEIISLFLINHYLGIDCSGLVYHILEIERKERNLKPLRKVLLFPYHKGIRKLIAKLRPAENAGVITFAHDSNSTVIQLKDIQPGDLITMIYKKRGSPAGLLEITNNSKNLNQSTVLEIDPTSYNHIIFIEKLEKEHGILKKVLYIHSIAWPSDGKYNHGVRRGEITIENINDSIEKQRWTEKGVMGMENYTHQKALKCDSCQIRRLKW
jgi:hypothetical protein